MSFLLHTSEKVVPGLTETDSSSCPIDSTSVASLRRARIFAVNYAARPTAAGIP
jgi:hypothetical protein